MSKKRMIKEVPADEWRVALDHVMENAPHPHDDWAAVPRRRASYLRWVPAPYVDIVWDVWPHRCYGLRSAEATGGRVVRLFPSVWVIELLDFLQVDGKYWSGLQHSSSMVFPDDWQGKGPVVGGVVWVWSSYSNEGGWLQDACWRQARIIKFTHLMTVEVYLAEGCTAHFYPKNVHSQAGSEPLVG